MLSSGVEGFDRGSCIPHDPFWNINREVAELLWRRGDGGTVSTRVAETVNRTTHMPVRNAKANFHALLATAVGLGTFYLACRVTDEPALRALGFVGAIGAARKTFEYLQHDRCR
jgi:hypothetical protein